MCCCSPAECKSLALWVQLDKHGPVCLGNMSVGADILHPEDPKGCFSVKTVIKVCKKRLKLRPGGKAVESGGLAASDRCCGCTADWGCLENPG